MLAATGAAVLAFLATCFFTPVAAAMARRWGVLDHPDLTRHKHHSESIPYLGGVSILLGLAIGAVIVVLTHDIPSALVRSSITVAAVAVALAVLGLLDDLGKAPASVRLLVHVACAAATWGAHIRVDIAPWDWMDLLITVLWIVGITNAFNLLDNMDGLTAGLAAIVGGSFAVLAVTAELSILSAGSAALAGAAAGFLVHNRAPARIYMGDTGSTVLGYLLAVMGLHLRFDNVITVTFLVPVVALGIPIMDTCLVVLARIRSRRPIFTGARDHMSHRLVALGLTKRQAVHLLYVAAASLGWLALILSRSEPATAWMVALYVIATTLFAGAFLMKVDVGMDRPADGDPAKGEGQVGG